MFAITKSRELMFTQTEEKLQVRLFRAGSSVDCLDIWISLHFKHWYSQVMIMVRLIKKLEIKQSV